MQGGNIVVLNFARGKHRVNLSKKSLCSCSLCQPWEGGRLTAVCHAVRHVWSPDRAERIDPVKRLWSWENRRSGVGRALLPWLRHNGSGSAAEDVRAVHLPFAAGLARKWVPHSWCSSWRPLAASHGARPPGGTVACGLPKPSMAVRPSRAAHRPCK